MAMEMKLWWIGVELRVVQLVAGYGVAEAWGLTVGPPVVGVVRMDGCVAWVHGMVVMGAREWVVDVRVGERDGGWIMKMREKD